MLTSRFPIFFDTYWTGWLGMDWPFYRKTQSVDSSPATTSMEHVIMLSRLQMSVLKSGVVWYSSPVLPHCSELQSNFSVSLRGQTAANDASIRLYFPLLSLRLLSLVIFIIYGKIKKKWFVRFHQLSFMWLYSYLIWW